MYYSAMLFCYTVQFVNPRPTEALLIQNFCLLKKVMEVTA